MRVAITTETFLPKMDGIVRVLLLLLDRMIERGVEPIIVAPQLGDEPLGDYRGAPIIHTRGVPLPSYPELRYAPSHPGTVRKLHAQRPDLVHITHPILVGLPIMFAAKWWRLPTIMSYHVDFANLVRQMRIFGPIVPVIRRGTRFFFNWADVALAPSRFVLEDLRAQGVDPVRLWLRGVDAERFHPRFADDSMRERLSDGHPDDVLMLYVGRVSAEKHLGLLRHALDAFPETRLAIVGDGPYRSEVEAQLVGTNTVFMGYLEGHDLAAAYASADVFVFPSALESFGLVGLEAMAAGLPVVSARVGGMPDVITEGETGALFDIDDRAGLIAALRSVIADRERLRAMGVAARAFAETLTWDAMMDEVIDLYYELVARHAAQRKSR